MSLPPSLARLGRVVHSLPISTGHLLTSARGVAFWAAIALPFGYLPLFGLDMVLSVEMFVLLLVINMVALVVGHSYHR